MDQTTSTSYEEFLEISSFKDRFGTCVGQALGRAGLVIDQLPVWELENLVHILYGKWPHCRDKITWRAGIKRQIQARFYAELYQKEPSPAVLHRNKLIEEALVLSDQAYKEEEKPKKEPRKPKKEHNKVTDQINTPNTTPDAVPNTTQNTTPAPEAQPEVKEPKAPKQKSEFSIKVAAMSLEDVIKWATELGIPAEKIEKHKAKPLGLAKMNISNMIRAKIKN